MNDVEKTPLIVAGYILQPCSDDLRENLLRIQSPLCAVLQAIAPLLSAMRDKPLAERSKIIGESYFAEFFPRLDAMDATIFIFITEAARVARLLGEGEGAFESAVNVKVTHSIDRKSRHAIARACAQLFLERLCQDGDKLQAAMN
jgi:hypothetical protein